MLPHGATDLFIRYVLTTVDEGTKAAVASQRAVANSVKETNAALAQQTAAEQRNTQAATRAATAGGRQAAAAAQQARANTAGAEAAAAAAKANQSLASSASAAAAASSQQAAATVAVGNRMAKGGAAVAAAGTKLSGLTLPIALVAGASAHLAVEFEKAMEMVHTQAGASQREVDTLRSKVLALAKVMPQSPEEMAKGLFHLESIGLRGAAAMDALKTAAEGAAVGNADLEDTATALGSAWLVNIKGAGDLHNVMGILNATVGAGNTTMGELVHALGVGLLPASKEAGLSISDVMGAMALFTDEGYQASSAAAQFSTALHFLYNPTNKARAAMEEMGLSGDQLAADMHKPRGLLVAMQDLKDHLKGVGGVVAQEQTLGQILPGGRGRILLTLLNQLDRYEQKLNQIDRTSRNFGEAVAKTHETASFRIRSAWSTIQVAGVNLGGHVLPALVPAIEDVANVVGKLAEGFSHLPHHVQSMIVVGGLFLAVLGPMLKMVGGLTKAIGFLFVGLGKLQGRLLGTAAANTTLAESEVAATAGATRQAVAMNGAAGAAMGGWRGGAAAALSRVPRALGIAGVGYMGAQIAGSAVGGGVGSAISSVGSGAALGAAAGSIIPGVGTAVGAVGGAVIGGLISYIHKRKGDIQNEIADVISLKDAHGAGRMNIQMHIGVIKPSKKEIKEVQDAIRDAKAATKAVDLVTGGAAGGISADDRNFIFGDPGKAVEQMRKSWEHAGKVSIAAFTRAVESGPKYQDANVLLQGFDASLKKVPIEFRDGAARSMIEYARSLNINGRLPERELETIIDRLASQWDLGVTGAGQAGARAAAAFSAGVKRGNAVQAAQDLLRDMSKTFAFLPQNVTLTTDNAQQVLSSSLKHLRWIIRTTHGQEQQDALTAYQNLLQIASTYSDRTRVASVSSFKLLRQQIKDELNALAVDTSGIWDNMARAALSFLDGLGNTITNLSSKKPKKRKEALSEVQDLGAFIGSLVSRRQGGWTPFAAGGMVPALVSPGEQIVHQGATATVPGAPVAADSVFTMLPAGSAVVTGHGQSLMAAGADLSTALAHQLPHFREGTESTGKPQRKKKSKKPPSFADVLRRLANPKKDVEQGDNAEAPEPKVKAKKHSRDQKGVTPGQYVSTAYGPPWGGIQGMGVTATGVDLRSNPHKYGIAVDPDQIKLGSDVYVTPNPFGRTGTFKAFDTGGAIQGKRIDFYDWRGREAQNAWGRQDVQVSGRAGSGGGGAAATKDIKGSTPIIWGQSTTRRGLLGRGQAFELGFEAGAANLSRPVRDLVDQIASIKVQTRRQFNISADPKKSTKDAKDTPAGTTMMDGHPVANWIVKYLKWARKHGWAGTVSSGFRTDEEQTVIYNSGVRPAAKPKSMGGPGSNHEGSKFPKGAVDVDQGHAAQLAVVLSKYKPPAPLVYAGAKDPVHFSFPHSGSYRRGGIVGKVGRVGSSIVQRFASGGRVQAALGNVTRARGGSLEAFANVVDDIAEKQVLNLRAQLLRQVRAGGTAKAVHRLQAALDVLDMEIGYRIGRIVGRTAIRSARIERRNTRLDQALRVGGIQQDSAKGQRMALDVTQANMESVGKNIGDLRKAAEKARRTGHPKKAAQIEAQMREAQGQWAELLVQSVEQYRASVTAAVQEGIDKMHTGFDAARTSLDQSFVINNIDEASSVGQKALADLLGKQVDATKKTIGDIQGQIAKAAASNDQVLVGQLTEQLTAMNAELAQYATDQVAATRAAVLAAAQEAVDAASAGVSAATSGLDILSAQQELVKALGTGASAAVAAAGLTMAPGTAAAGTAASGAQRAEYIQTTVVPALQKQLQAQQAQLTTQQQQGADANSIQATMQSIGATQLAILQASLDAQNAIKDNTESLKKFGGTTSFEFGGQEFTDLISVGTGA